MADQVTPAVTSTEPMSKVFVGNLAFRTTDQDLQTLFKDCGEIKAGVIITRGRRSLGYGFIEFVKPEDAAACVEVMNKKEFLGRPLKVELAKDPSERPDRLERTGSDDQEAPADKAPAPKRGRKAPAAAEGAVQPVQTQTQATQTGAPKPKRGKKQKNLAPEQPAAPAVAPVAVDEKGPSAKRKPNRPSRKNKKKAGGSPVIPSDNTAPVVTAPVTPAAEEKPKKKKEPKQPRVPPAERVNSKTTLFVANLPFTITDESLAEVFKSYKVKSAHVVRTYNNRSRGYGFVEFETEADQLKALNEKNGTQLPSLNGEPRAIAISISSSNGSAPEQTTDQTPK